MTGYTGFSGNTSEQSGHYLALKFDAVDGVTVSVELVGGTVGHPVELDSDMNMVLRITNPETQKIKVIATDGTTTDSKTYSLTRLVLAA